MSVTATVTIGVCVSEAVVVPQPVASLAEDSSATSGVSVAPLASVVSVDPPTATATATAPDQNGQSEIDLVLLLDCTGSMGQYIAKAKACLLDISTRFEQQYPGHGRLKIGVVAYRDHPPQDMSFITLTAPLTSDIPSVRTFLGELSARGGGDDPEAVGAALGEAVQLDWRPDAVKVAVLIADAPPHGIGEMGDGFPQGVPGSTDPFSAIEALAALGVRLYTVGCLPAINRYRFTIPFFVEAARKTGGKPVALEGADRLGDVIFGASLVEMGLNELKVVAQSHVASVSANNPGWSRGQVFVQVASNMREEGMVYRSLGGAMDLSEKTNNSKLFEGVCDLSGARAKNSLAVPESVGVEGVHGGLTLSASDVPVYRSLGGVSSYRSLGGCAPVEEEDDNATPSYRSLDGCDSEGSRKRVSTSPIVTEGLVTADLLGSLLGDIVA